MNRWTRIFAAVVVTCVPVVGVYADMTPVSQAGPALRVSAQICDGTDLEPTNVRSPLLGPGVVDLDSLSFACLAEGVLEVQQADATAEPVLLRSDDATSLELCLYGLMGLGLCKSAPWVKKLSFASVPDWYHCGGPYQIGGSHAVGPGCLRSAAISFVQPECRPRGLSPQYRGGMIVHLSLKSQFTPTALASRGPPDLAINNFFDA